LSFELIGIGVRQRDVIPVEVAHHHVGSILQRRQYSPAYLLPNRHLCRVGKQPVAPIAQRQSGINDDLAVLDLHHTGETAYSQRLHSKNLDMHVMLRQS